MILKKHKSKIALIFFALVIGLITAAPALQFRYFDEEYQGIDLLGADGEEAYLAEIKEVYEGNLKLGNVYLVDHKDDPYVRQPLSPLIVASIAKTLKITVVEANILTKILFPAILSIIMFLFFKDVFKRKDMALVGTTFLMLAPATFTFLSPNGWLPFFLHGDFIYSDSKYLYFSRPINPQISFIFFFGYLLVLWRLLFIAKEKKKKQIYSLLSCLILGLSFYTYFFSYSYSLIFTGLLSLWFLYKKQWKIFLTLVGVIVGAFIIGIPYVLNTLEVIKSPYYDQLAGRLGVAVSREIIFSKVLWATLLIMFIFLKKSPRNIKLFLYAILFSGVIATNQQLITGKTVPIPDHYYWYFIQPFVSVSLLYILLTCTERLASKKVRHYFVTIIVVVSFVAGILLQRTSYNIQRDTHISKQKYSNLITIIETTLPKDATVFSNDVIGNMIPVYTDKNIYQIAGMGDFLVDRDRLQHTYYIDLSLKGITEENIEGHINENREATGGWIYSQTYHARAGCYGCFPEEIKNEIIEGYKEFLKEDFLIQLKKYPIDYIVWDKESEPDWKLDEIFFQIEYKEGNITIFKVS